MANKDHSLDSKIIDAALTEFLEKGFDKASLRTIAKNADVTIGAIYTRYKTKDILFTSLVEPLIKKIADTFSELEGDYFSDDINTQENWMLKNMQIESDAILHILFDDYDRATLLLCRSRGSSLENFFKMIVDKKIEETSLFFKSAGIENLSDNVIRLFVNAQFNMYFEIINEGYSLNEAKEMMNAAIVYHTGGWLSLIDKMNRER